MQTELRGDYIGFSFGGTHSSELGIVRVSDGSRYSQNLFPSFSDRTATVTGGHGTYYFGTDYSQRQISLSIAFDCVEETQIRQMQQLFAPNGELKELWFDELPYKAVKAKISGTPQLKYIVFDEIRNEIVDEKLTQVKHRVYKGEGTLQFTVFSPFAYGRIKYQRDMFEKQEDLESFEPGVTYYYLSTKTNEDGSTSPASFKKTTRAEPKEGVGYYILKPGFENRGEWLPSAQLLVTKTGHDIGGKNTVKVYNPGDLDAPFELFFSAANFKTLTQLDLSYSGGPHYTLRLKPPTDEEVHTEDLYICVNTKTNLIEGYKVDETTGDKVRSGHLYNRHIESGDFFKIPAGLTDKELTIAATGATINSIEYNYLYY